MKFYLIRRAGKRHFCFLFLSLVAGSAFLLAFAPIHAAQAETADEIVNHGLELRRQARDAEALTEFNRAWAIQATPRIEAQIALAEQALGLWVSAEEHLLNALAKRDEVWIAKNHARLSAALAVIQGHLGTVEIWGIPVGATVLLNEKPVGTLPLKRGLRVPDEEVVLRARAAGYIDWTRTIRIEAGRTIRQHVDLVPVVPAVATVPAPSRGAKIATSASPEGPQPVPEVAGTSTAASPDAENDGAAVAEHPGHPLRPLAWVAGGGAVFGLAVGVAETFVARSKSTKFNAMAKQCAEQEASVMATCQSLEDGFNNARKFAIVGYAVGGGLAVASTILFLLSSSDHDGEKQFARACTVGIRGFSCAMAF